MSKDKPTLLSLFDGSGGFPLAASMCGITPVAASEIEPYPIAVTRSRFPNMKHLGSVTDIRGDEIEPVDVITFGSPCQDLSVAGKRAGLKHTENGDDETTRSGLFMEAIRIIKEMREATNGVYPRIAVWENVPGAFSSNKGEDFRIVLEEFIKVVEPTATMPAVPKNGWAYSDVYCGDGWSLAYRVLDAQYWGVPQRRRRIYLVADFRGQRAGKISFEREGLRGYFAESRAKREAAAGDAEGGVGTANREGKCFGIDHAITTGGNCTAQGPCVYEDIQATLKASGPHAVCYAIDKQGSVGTEDRAVAFDTYNMQATGDKTVTLRAGSEYNYAPIFEPVGLDIYNSSVTGDVAASLTTATGQGPSNTGPSVAVPYTLKIRSGCEGGGKGALIQEDMSATLATNNDQYLFLPVCSSGEVAGTLDASYFKGCGMRQGVEREYVVEPIAVATQQGGAEITENGVCPTITAAAGMSGNNQPWVAYPDDCILDDQGGSQISVRTDGKSPTLRAEMHGNVPAVMEPVTLEPGIAAREGGHIYASVSGTLRANAGDNQMAVAYMEPVPIHDQATRFFGKRGDKSDGKGNGLGIGNPGDPMNTLTGGDRHAIAYWDGSQTCGTLTANNAGGSRRMPDKDNFNCVIEEQPLALDRAFFNQGQNALYDPQYYDDGTNPTLVARGPNAVAVRYIVRRLTPTECARLQGFPDEWAHIDQKSDFTDEEYAFWLEVRNTHAAINDKAVKDYTREQMLTWYNKLHTDSAEYKLWGNGIALPCALYVMQGIAEVLNEN